jgi:mannose/cellobiose epimerase-like protein (N-acyl-D-glucosamine 2-epimerase family)
MRAIIMQDLQHGGYFETPDALFPRRQNPHMHLFEALLALYVATGDTSILNRADKILYLLYDIFIDKKSGLLLEHFTQDWLPLPETNQRVEPGHMFEWTWLLFCRSQLYSDAEHTAKHKALSCAKALYNRATDVGLHTASGLVPDYLEFNNQTLSTHARLWPQLERLKAMCALYSVGMPIEASSCGELSNTIFEYYFSNQVPGLWHDHLSLDKKSISSSVPSSILYHIMTAAEAISLIG